jgi:hypothetical protein
MARPKIYESGNAIIAEKSDGLPWIPSKTEEAFEKGNIRYYLQNNGLGIVVGYFDKSQILLNTQVYTPANEDDSLADESGTPYPDIATLVTALRSFFNASVGGSAVESFNGRTGAVLPEFGDYNSGQISYLSKKVIRSESDFTDNGSGQYELGNYIYEFDVVGTLVLTKPLKLVGTAVVTGSGVGISQIAFTGIIGSAIISDGNSLTITNIAISGDVVNTSFIDMQNSTFLLIKDSIFFLFKDMGILSNVQFTRMESMNIANVGTGFDLQNTIDLIDLRSVRFENFSALNSALFYTSVGVSVLDEIEINNGFFDTMDYGINLPESSFVQDEGLSLVSCKFENVDSPVSADQNSPKVFLVRNTSVNDNITELQNTEISAIIDTQADATTVILSTGVWYPLELNPVYSDLTWFKNETLISGESGVRYISSVKHKSQINLGLTVSAENVREYEMKIQINNTDGLGNITSLESDIPLPVFDSLQNSRNDLTPFLRSFRIKKDQHISIWVRQNEGTTSNITVVQNSQITIK